MKTAWWGIAMMMVAGMLNAQGLRNGLILHYPLDGDFQDFSSSGNDGIGSGVTFTLDYCGSPNFAASFATNTFMQIPFQAGLQVQYPLSFSFRVKFTNYNSSTNYLLWTTNEALPTDPGFRGVFVNHLNGSMSVRLGNGANFNASGTRIYSAPFAVTNNQWYQVTIIIPNQSSCQIYVDCVAKAVASSGPIGPISYSSNSGFIGKAFFPPNGTSTYFNQQLDDFRMWNRAITPNEIAGLCLSDTTVFEQQTCSPAVVFGQTFEAPIDTVFAKAPGCNSYNRVKLTPPPAFTFSSNLSLCPNIPYFFFGDIYFAPVDTTIISQDCDTILNLVIAARNCDTTTVIDTLCPGESFELGGNSFFAPFVGYIKPPGVDSTVFLNLYEGNLNYSDTVQFNGCLGETIDTLGLFLVFPFLEPIYSPNCDSVLWLDGRGVSECREHCEAFVPNSFTPNADGLNDFLAYSIPPQAELKSTRVFNRWGEMIFETRDRSLFWDGTYQGQQAPIDIYCIRVQYQCKDENLEFVAFVQLVR